MKTIMTGIFVLFIFNLAFSQKFSITSNQIDNQHVLYKMVDEKGKVIRELDTAKYLLCFNENQLGHFAVFAFKNKKGWFAIDKNENILFEVYNNSIGEISPDWLIDGKIRIVDVNGKIGFANQKGQIVIKPQFEMVSSFHKNKAVIAENCELIPWDEHQAEHPNGCQHFSIQCKKYGYINATGKITYLDGFTFDQVAKKINWKEEF